jgi:hypothetical protein
VVRGRAASPLSGMPSAELPAGRTSGWTPARAGEVDRGDTAASSHEVWKAPFLQWPGGRAWRTSSGPSQRLSTPTHDCPTRIPSEPPACQPGPGTRSAVCHSSHRCSPATQGTCRRVTGATSARRQEPTLDGRHRRDGRLRVLAAPAQQPPAVPAPPAPTHPMTAPPTVTPLQTPPTASPLPTSPLTAAPAVPVAPTAAGPRSRTVEPAPSAEPNASGPSSRSRRASLSATRNPEPPARELPPPPSR